MVFFKNLFLQFGNNIVPHPKIKESYCDSMCNVTSKCTKSCFLRKCQYIIFKNTSLPAPSLYTLPLCKQKQLIV